jgi:hypothetical protein
MLRFLILCLVIILPIQSYANHLRDWPLASAILVPTPQFDPWRKGNAYTGKLTLIRVPHSQVYAKCRSLANNPDNIGPRVLACAIRHSTTKCTVVVADGMPTELYRAVRRHEIGHCKGWKHPNTTLGQSGTNQDIQNLEEEHVH